MQLYDICDTAVFSELHDQLASLDRHAQVTRCFSAVAELFVQTRGEYTRARFINSHHGQPESPR